MLSVAPMTVAASKLREVVKAFRGDKDQWQNIKREVDAFFDKKA